jgi:membrane protein
VSPWTFGGLRLRELGTRTWTELWEDELLDRAAALSYYFVFALFPTLLFLTALVGLLPGADLIERLMASAREVLPADAASLLARTLAEIQRGAGGGVLSVGVLAALWGASKGMTAIIATLNVVYEVESPRPWWRRQLVSLALTLAFSAFAVGAQVTLVFGERIGQGLAAWVGVGHAFTVLWSWVQWPLGLLFLLTGIDLVYHFAPAVRQRWHWLTPGSVLAVVAWILTSVGLRLYVSRFADYNATYGSIGGAILLLLWLYLSGLALLVGGEVNAVIAKAASERGDEIAAPLAEPGAGGAGEAGSPRATSAGGS